MPFSKHFLAFFNRNTLKYVLEVLYKIALISSVAGLVLLVADFGFEHSQRLSRFFNTSYLVIVLIGIVLASLRHLNLGTKIRKKVMVFDAISVLFSLFVVMSYFLFAEDYAVVFSYLLRVTVFLTFVREFSELKLVYRRAVLNPAQLFVTSFIVIIFIGSLLLKLPNATMNGISFIDALFTSTSAVCVTGLAVVDTGKDFTVFGQFIILFLIQIGGLGILTFASYFSYFFKGESSYENQLTMGDVTSSRKLGEVFSTLKYIIIITFSIELISAIAIFFTVNDSLFSSLWDKLFFSVFHAVSAFCNAGFSTLSDSLYDGAFKFNYGLHLVIILTFVFGGLGFPIVSNVVQFFRYKFSNLLLFGKKKVLYRPWVLTMNSRITLITTLSITVVAFFVFYALEYNNTLSEHSGIGKIVTAMFGATTPRTAGFNSIDSSAMTLPTLLFVILLMWIGASPASTGGGIKTSTFAIATLNILSLAKGKSRIEIFRREISDISIRRAFATIALSLIVIGTGIMVIAAVENDLSITKISFECFSAYSTVGLSLGITSSLSLTSKCVLIVIMFVGRVSMLSIIIAVFRKVKHKNYRYPSEEIMIN